MSENDSNEETTDATPRPEWWGRRWGALTSEQKSEWISTVRQGELGRFTADELWRYRDLADQRSEIQYELDRTKRELDDLRDQAAELDAMLVEATTELTSYQNEIEGLASRRAIAARGASS